MGSRPQARPPVRIGPSVACVTDPVTNNCKARKLQIIDSRKEVVSEVNTYIGETPAHGYSFKFILETGIWEKTDGWEIGSG
jgi:hypothetical protein